MEEEHSNSTTAKFPQTEEFNRTVVVNKLGRQKSSNSTPLQKFARHFMKKKAEIEDLIGGKSISQYTDVEPDTTAVLAAPLSNLDSKYSVLEEFAQGGHATVSIARDKNLRRIVAVKSLKKEEKSKGEVV